MQEDPIFRTVRAGESMGKSFQYPSPAQRWALFSVYRGDRVQGGEIICPFLHYYYEQKLPSTPIKVIIKNVSKTFTKKEVAKWGFKC